MSGPKVPIVRVPVLTPRLSSYWLALVTDVDVTTGRNLIDSMGTEVRGHRHSASARSCRASRWATRRPYAARSRTDGRASSRRLEDRGQREQHRQRPGDVGEDRRQDAAGRAALAGRRRRRGATAANASITLPVASVRDGVGDGGDRRPGSAVVAAYAAPRKNSSSATPLTAVISTSTSVTPWSAWSSTGRHLRSSAGIWRTTSPPTTKTPASARPSRIGGEDRPARAGRARTIRPRCRAGGEGADRPDRRQPAWRGRTARCRARCSARTRAPRRRGPRTRG